MIWLHILPNICNFKIFIVNLAVIWISLTWSFKLLIWTLHKIWFTFTWNPLFHDEMWYKTWTFYVSYTFSWLNILISKVRCSTIWNSNLVPVFIFFITLIFNKKCTVLGLKIFSWNICINHAPWVNCICIQNVFQHIWTNKYVTNTTTITDLSIEQLYIFTFLYNNLKPFFLLLLSLNESHI